MRARLDEVEGDVQVTEQEIIDLQDAVDGVITTQDTLAGWIGTMSNLVTTSKANLVAALNEAVQRIGTLNGLYTATKTNLVAAINEVYATLLNKANTASPTFTGTPLAPTAAYGATGAQIATVDFVNNTQTSAPALVAYSPTGVRNTSYTSLTSALQFASGGGRVIVNRATRVVSGNTLVGGGVTLDLQNNPLDLIGNALHLYEGARVINNKLIFNASEVFIRNGGVQEIQGGIVAAKITFQAGIASKIILDKVFVTSFAATPPPATVGAFEVVMRNGSSFFRVDPDPLTTITVEAPATTGGTGGTGATGATGAVDYTAEDLHTDGTNVNLTAADLNRAHVVSTPNAAGVTLSLPAAPGADKALLRVRIGRSCAGMVTVDGNGNLIDGKPSRKLWAGEVREIMWTGTEWTKTDDVVKPMRAKIKASGGGSFTIPQYTLYNMALPVVVDASLPGMTTAPDKITTLRAGLYVVKATYMANCNVGMAELDLFIAVNGSDTEPRSRSVIMSNPGDPGGTYGGLYFLHPKLDDTFELNETDTVRIMQYGSQSVTIDNRNSAPSYLAQLELIEQYPW
jgi:hypothetical protein